MDLIPSIFAFSFPRVELEDVFQKLQKTPGVSIKKVTSSNATNSTERSKDYSQNAIFLNEIEEIKIKDEKQDVELLVEVPTDNIKQEYNDEDQYYDDEDDMDSESIKESLDENMNSSEHDSDEESDENYASSSKKLIKKPPAKRIRTAPVEKVIDGPLVFSCTKCKNRFDSFYELVNHMKSKVCYTEEFICATCSKHFINSRALCRHKRTHKPKTRLMCEECAKTYFNKFDLEMHMQSAHNHVPNTNSKLVFKCHHCDEEFSNHVALFTHVQEHAREKKEGSKLCETCGKNCINLKAYHAHRRIHAGVVKNFACPDCDKRFSKEFLLTQHSHIHTGIKMYRCDSCDKAFAKRDSLRIHNKNYHQDKTTERYDYTCEDCKTGFKSFDNFKIHVAKCNSQNS